MARRLDKHAGDGGMERKARWINKQGDENSTGELAVWGRGMWYPP